MTEHDYKDKLRSEIIRGYTALVDRAAEIGDTDTLLSACSLGGGLIAEHPVGRGPMGFQMEVVEEEPEGECE